MSYDLEGGKKESVPWKRLEQNVMDPNIVLLAWKPYLAHLRQAAFAYVA